jgi:regulator of PEP synthase PpsR (kinase-PPPase family)
MNKNKTINLHLISDGTGQTVRYLAKSALAQFEGVKAKCYYWPLICGQDDLQKCLNKIMQKPGVVLYTLRNQVMAEKLNLFCDQEQLPCLSVIDDILQTLEKYLGANLTSRHNHFRLNTENLGKVMAINFAIKHDDGACIESIDQADIIIVGASRVSKTPTAIYLACNGYKTANIPYIQGIKLPERLLGIQDKMIVALVASPARLSEVRFSRLSDAPFNISCNYASISAVSSECRLAKQIFLEHNWPIVDVTYNAIEETAAEIIKLYYLFQAKMTKL